MKIEHIALFVNDLERCRDAVDELTRRLASEGEIVISPPRVTGDGYYESVVLDCNGNQIEITL